MPMIPGMAQALPVSLLALRLTSSTGPSIFARYIIHSHIEAPSTVAE